MIVVYTTIFGWSDNLKAAPTGASRAVCFVDDPARYAGQDRGWELIQHPAPNARREAWHLRCIPHLLFPTARKTIWIDASFTITDLDRIVMDSGGHEFCALRHHGRDSCYAEGRKIIDIRQAEAEDVNRQLDGYKAEGFDPSTLTISCLLVRENTPRVTQFNERWDAEIKQHRGDNTQLSLDYSAWRVGLPIHYLHGVYKNNDYAHHNHKDHKELRKPYDTDTTVRRDI